MPRLQKCLSIAILCSLAACATTGTDGVVEIGTDKYMVGGQGKFTDLSGSAVKARFFEQAKNYCAQKGRAMEALNSTAQDAGYGTYASAEVQFRCVAK